MSATEHMIIAGASVGNDFPLGQALSEGLNNLVTNDGTLSIFPLRLAFLYLLWHGMIHRDTYYYLRPLFEYKNWSADEYYLNEVRYLPQDCVNVEDPDSDVSLTINPLETKHFIMAILRDDDLISEYLCLDSFEDLIASADGYHIEAGLIKKLAFERWDNSYFVDAFIINNQYIHFLYDKENGVADWKLCVKSLDNSLLSWEQESTIIHRGMTRQYILYGQHLYFPMKNVSAYLHWDINTGKQEILQSIRIIGCRHLENLVYVNYLTDKICYEEHGVEHVVCDYDDSRCYLAMDDYVLVTPPTLQMIEMPYHISYDGTKSEATPVEKANTFWESFIIHNTNIRQWIYMSMSDSMLTFRVNFLTQDRILCIENLEMVIKLIRENKSWRGGKAYPVTGILNALRRSGIDPKEDISQEMYHLVYYAQKVLTYPKESCMFAPVFYYIVYKLSKRDDFAYLLKHDPEKLFHDDVAVIERQEKKKMKMRRQLGISMFESATSKKREHDNIGLFYVRDHKINAFVISKKKGILEDTTVKCKNTKNKYQGSVYYDIIKDKYIIDWPERDAALTKELLKVFHHDEGEVEFSVAETDSLKGGEACEG